MQNPLVNLISRRQKALLALVGVTGLALAGGQTAAQAQVTLSLSPTALTAASGTTATFTVSLTGGGNLGGFDFNVMLDPTYLSFVGASPFMSGSTNPFDTENLNELSSPGDLRVAYGQVGLPVSNANTTALGTFQVSVLRALPAGGTAITFGAPGSADDPTNGSGVFDLDTNNVLTGTSGARLAPAAAVPETSTALTLCLLLTLAAGGLALQVRRRTASSSN